MVRRRILSKPKRKLFENRAVGTERHCPHQLEGQAKLRGKRKRKRVKSPRTQVNLGEGLLLQKNRKKEFHSAEVRPHFNGEGRKVGRIIFRRSVERVKD